MSQLFLTVLNRSITAGWLVLAVLLLRLFLKRAPKRITVLLWAAVALRLTVPFSIESALSLVPSAETVPVDIGMAQRPAINSGIPVINNAVNPVLSQSAAPALGGSANPLQILIAIATNVWLLGLIAMLLYTVASYWRLTCKVHTAIPLKANIYQCDAIFSPFVLGIWKPKIYLPFHLDEESRPHVIAHEQAHIRRRDHWWKPLGFLVLSIHWFNPLIWLSYVLLCRDIELACDETVIRKLGSDQRADYTQALLICSAGRQRITACPLAFGEIGVKERIKSVLHYKKPTVWILAVAIAAFTLLSLCFLTNPKDTFQAPNWPDLADIPSNYTLEQAKSDGCVVLVGEELRYGKRSWFDFYSDASQGRKAIVRVYHTDNSGQYTLQELFFDGQRYELRYFDRNGNAPYVKTYSHLNRGTYGPVSGNDIFYEYFILTDGSYQLNYEDYLHYRPSLPAEDHSPAHMHTVISYTVSSDAVFGAASYSDIKGISLENACASVHPDRTDLTVEWKNETNTPVLYGLAYTVERLENGYWVSCSINDPVFTSVAYSLPGNSAEMKRYTLSELFDVSKPGTYRFLSSCTLDPWGEKQACTLWTTFTIA